MSPEPPLDRIRVAIVDDHAMFRDGIREILASRDDISVVGEAVNGASALQLVRDLVPDVLLLDIRLPDRSGLEVASEVGESWPSVRVLMLSAYGDDAYVRAALDAGVSGYVLKAAPARELIGAIRAANSGSVVLDATLARQSGSRTAPGDQRLGPALTARELDVLKLAVQGLRNKQIARELEIGLRTVETHLSHVLTKTGTSSRTELVVHALRSGLITGETHADG